MSVLDLMRSPYFKGKGFNPSLIARGGIPREADSRLNPKVIGTPAWLSFWKDQLYCIHNGIQTGNLFIPGRYYYYLNFNSMFSAGGIISPDMCDLHLEFVYLFEYCKKNGLSLIIAKKRRAGISEITHKAVIDYGFRFSYAYKCGIAAGKKTFADELTNKWTDSEALLPPELSVKLLTLNKKEITAGYKYKNDLGESTEGGTKNKIYIETFFQDAHLFKGLYLNDCIAEECGQFEKLKEFYSATRPALMKGERQVGTFLFYGTGGNMTKESKDFHEIWNKAGTYKFEKLLIPAHRFHAPYYGGSTKDGTVDEKIPNLLLTHKPYELIGVEDFQAAKQALLAEREEKKKTGDVELYMDHLKNYPFTEQDIFKKTIVNVFDTEVMQDQADRITQLDAKGLQNYVRCQLDWVKDNKGEIVFPRQVVFRIDNDTPEDGDVILIHKDHLKPIKDFNDLYCAGIDSYDKHLSKTSKSKGAMCVLIRRNSIQGQMQLAPVATICCRPRRKEIFFEMCLKLSIFFDLVQKNPASVLVDVRNSAIIEYFREMSYINSIAYRPRKFEREDTTQQHDFGVDLNNHSKPLMIGLMHSAILDYSKDIWFPELINQLQNYDEAYIGSDNDLGDAYGIALMQDASNEVQSRNMKDYDDPDVFQLQEWKTDHNGNTVRVVKTDTKIFGEEQDVGGRFLSY